MLKCVVKICWQDHKAVSMWDWDENNETDKSCVSLKTHESKNESKKACEFPDCLKWDLK